MESFGSSSPRFVMALSGGSGLETILGRELSGQLRGRVWQGLDAAYPRQPTGHASLDALIGGWPRGLLTELLYAQTGIGELRLVLPLLRSVTRANGHVIWIDPPWLPYIPLLDAQGVVSRHMLILRNLDATDRLWATERAARLGMSLVMAWLPEPGLKDKHLRRLQLAAEAGHGSLILHRPAVVRHAQSPAALRLGLASGKGRGLEITVLRQRGGTPGRSCVVAMHAWEPERSSRKWRERKRA